MGNKMDYKLLKDSIPLETAFAIYQIQLLLAKGKITQIQHDEIIAGFVAIIEKYIEEKNIIESCLYMIGVH